MPMAGPVDVSLGFPCRLHIVVQVIGSLDEVEIFIAFACALKKDGHRIPIASHDEFRSMVEEYGLEFFPVGGDPAEFVPCVVSSPRLDSYLTPTPAAATARRRLIYEDMLQRLWESCVAPDPDQATDRPFIADVIIANPASFAHVHCAERLKIPCHLISTIPWTSTAAFAHPLAGAKFKFTLWKNSSNDENSGQEINMNVLSFMATNLFAWQELGEVINRWRVDKLQLPSISSTEGPQLIDALKIPITYCWSPALVPKPLEWDQHIDVCEIFCTDVAPYAPSQDLQRFLEAGSPPIYVEFGTLVAEDPEQPLAMILSAVRDAGVRAIISHDWNTPKLIAGADIFYTMDCSREWVLAHVPVVIHRGEAGMTGCGLRHGCSTITITRTGDHSFWGMAAARAGAGPKPLAYEALTAESLTEAIRFCLTPETRSAATAIGHKLATGDGLSAAVASFYRHLPANKMACDLMPSDSAICEYQSHGKKLKISRGAVAILWNQGKINMADLKIRNSGNIMIDHRRWEPISAVTAASLATMFDIADAAIDAVRIPLLEYRKMNGPAVPKMSISRSDSAVEGCCTSDAELPVTTELKLIEAMEEEEARNNLVPILTSTAFGLGRVVTRSTRGVLVDIPLAATEGMRAVPQLWGESVEAHKPVEDWRSGFKVAARSFTGGISSAVTGLFIRTAEGKKRGGTMGAVKGLGQGALGFATKSTGAIAGLVTYPAQGLSRSIATRGKNSARQEIMEAVWAEADWLYNSGKLRGDTTAIISGFEAFFGPKS